MTDSRKLRNSVAAVFSFENQIFVAQRHYHLRAFPGYWSFPGGKIDSVDFESEAFDFQLQENIEKGALNALVREIQEELSLDLVQLYQSGGIKNISLIGVASTPKYIKYRFCLQYYYIQLKEKIDFGELNKNGFTEIRRWCWIIPEDFVDSFEIGRLLTVPPTVSVMNKLCSSGTLVYEDFTPLYEDEELPYTIPLGGLRQYFFSSDKRSPADTRNCFFIENENSRGVLVDPSPCSESELDRFKSSLQKLTVEKIFLTRHYGGNPEHILDLARYLSVSVWLGEKTNRNIIGVYGEDYFNGVPLEFVGEGDILCKWNTGDVHILEVPGYEDGQLALCSGANEWCIVGDLVQEFGTVVIKAPKGDMGVYVNSLKKVIKLNPDVIFPAHGIGFGGVQKLQTVLAQKEGREKQILECLKDGLERP